jgi:glycosyltransferase involved in cell wall biosynthesis
MYLPKLPGWRNAYAALARLRYQRPRRILAVSNATKRDLCRELGTDPDLVDVAFHGVDHARFHAKAAADDRERVATLLGDGPPYVLYLGAGDPRKDLRTLIQAFTLSRLRGDARLVIAGRLGASRTRELRRQSRALGVEDKVTLTGYVPEEQVPALYRSARLHVFVSRYEGFGLPVLEALACGAPTVTSPGSSLDEVAGDAALIVPVAEPDALRSALETLFYDEDTRSELRRRGLERAQRFTWRACAESTLEFWRKALG